MGLRIYYRSGVTLVGRVMDNGRGSDEERVLVY